MTIEYPTTDVGVLTTNNMVTPYAAKTNDALFRCYVGVASEVTLPTVVSMAGRFVSIVYDSDHTENLTINVNGGSDKIVTAAGFATSIVLNAVHEFVVLFSDGSYWYTITKST